jgi:hypothetical protein
MLDEMAPPNGIEHAPEREAPQKLEPIAGRLCYPGRTLRGRAVGRRFSEGELRPSRNRERKRQASTP